MATALSTFDKQKRLFFNWLKVENNLNYHEKYLEGYLMLFFMFIKLPENVKSNPTDELSLYIVFLE